MIDGGEPTGQSPAASPLQSTEHPTLDYHVRDSRPPSATPASQLAALLLKILAIYCFAMAAPGLIALPLTLIRVAQFSATEFIDVIYWLALGLSGAVIFWNADRWAPKLVSGPPAAGSAINTLEAQAIAISVLGLYLLAHPLPVFARDVVVVLTDPQWHGAGFPSTSKPS